MRNGTGLYLAMALVWLPCLPCDAQADGESPHTVFVDALWLVAPFMGPIPAAGIPVHAGYEYSVGRGGALRFGVRYVDVNDMHCTPPPDGIIADCFDVDGGIYQEVSIGWRQEILGGAYLIAETGTFETSFTPAAHDSGVRYGIGWSSRDAVSGGYVEYLWREERNEIWAGVAAGFLF